MGRKKGGGKEQQVKWDKIINHNQILEQQWEPVFPPGLWMVFLKNNASSMWDNFADNIFLEFILSGRILATEAVAGTQVCTWEEKIYPER